MSDQDVKTISSATGNFSALQLRSIPGLPSGQAQPAGNAQPETGNTVPAPAKIEPDLDALAAKLNIASQSIGRDLRFKVDMNSGQSVIQVLDRETGEIIREIPPDKTNISLSVNGDVELRLYDRVV
ncbi:MAG: flagellar protein FlaG [Gammaproteobacteria bacterium]|nr:flagellar protein FlaG [Gammaproteobacteria bacterium]